MKLVAEILTGTLFYVEVKEDATVGDLKKQIGNQENLPSERLILLLDNADRHFLLDKVEVGLKEHGVKDGSHIYVFIAPIGEGLPKSPLSTPYSVPNNPSASFNGNQDELSAYFDIPDKRSV